MDIVCHVCRRAAEGAGAAVYGPIPQADFLAALGIGVRLESLLKGCGALDNQRARDLAAGYSRQAAPPSRHSLLINHCPLQPCT